jgi:hypothetical protein
MTEYFEAPHVLDASGPEKTSETASTITLSQEDIRLMREVVEREITTVLEFEISKLVVAGSSGSAVNRLRAQLSAARRFLACLDKAANVEFPSATP